MNPVRIARSRATVVRWLFVALFFAFAIWFFKLAVTPEWHGEDMCTYAERKLWEAPASLPAEPGEMLHRLGSPIAINVPSYPPSLSSRPGV